MKNTIRLDDQALQVGKMEAVGALAGGVAHEFNNLLQAILGYANFALEGLSPQDQRAEDLQEILKAANRATVLTRQLLSFGRRQALCSTLLDANEIITDLQKMLRPLIGEHIELNVALAPDAGMICADPTMIQQMLLNLCINARDAMPTGGTLSVATENVVLKPAFCRMHCHARPGQHLVIRVADTGSGMPAKIKEQIFEPFFTTKPSGQGTGLGLPMVHRVVQQHRGAIDVKSKPGGGTTFQVFLPSAKSREKKITATTGRDAPGGTETVLVADDEPLVRDLAARILTRAGYRVLAAADGEQAVRIFEQHADDISLALLDMVMPKMLAHEVYQRIKRIKPEVRVLFCTGYALDMPLDQLLASEGLVLVQKPFAAHRLLHSVRRALDQTTACCV